MSLAAWRRPSETRPDPAAINGRIASPHPHAPQAQVHTYHAHAPPPIYIPSHLPAHLPLPRGHNSARSPRVLSPVSSPQSRENAWAHCPASGVPGPHMNMGRVCAGDASGHCIYCRRRVFVKGAYSPSPN
ncbi:hypothetical protein CcaverHIS002_0309970 [Cutaneotrichosporon cavernicola]|nr:hypothetical protein CcaverHIS002_0309970 [Cutaneotrichosporon cavernicola]BEI98691.1 hypothetical protein CcaverHIS631_0309900 [Cutaneotrichosporon cavernicola]BEJ06461.1 hypothetical protein CcaverHIS641_0309830 [Cutaneotrichosporon cavernicola]